MPLNSAGSPRRGEHDGDVRGDRGPSPAASSVEGMSLRAASVDVDLEDGPERKPTLLSRAGTTLQRAASSVQMQQATSLPAEDDDLRHAATMPVVMDVEGDRPFYFGLWKTQQLVGFVLGVVVVVVFLSTKVITRYGKTDAMVAVSVVTALFWLCEVMPIYVTALLPVVLMPLFEITSTQIAASSYWNWVSMLFLGAFMVDVAMEHVQLPRRLLLEILRRTGVTRGWVVLAMFMLVAWLLSMVCSDVAVTLMLAPFATSLLNTAQECAMDSAAEAVEEGARVETAEEAAKPYTRFGVGLCLGIAYAATAGGIATTIGTPANALLAGQDILAGTVFFDNWLRFAFPISFTIVIIAYVLLYFMYARNVELPLTHEVLLEQEWSLVTAAGHVSCDEVMVGLIGILLVILLCLQPLINNVIQNPLGEPLSGSATTACLCACLLFLIPSSVRRGEALLTWRTAQERVPWGVLLLIGGGFSLARGFQESGLNEVLGEAVADVVPHIPLLAINFVIVLLVIVLIQLMNSVATAAWVMPVLVSASLSSVINPLRLLLPATIACSLSFLLPTASPSNAVIFGKSRDLSEPLRIRNFIRTGAPLTLMVVVFASLLSYSMGLIVFEVDAPFPREFCSVQVNCVWKYLSGEVEGRFVSSQACMPLDAYNGTLCRLWNGSLVETDNASDGVFDTTAPDPEPVFETP